MSTHAVDVDELLTIGLAEALRTKAGRAMVRWFMDTLDPRAGVADEHVSPVIDAAWRDNPRRKERESAFYWKLREDTGSRGQTYQREWGNKAIRWTLAKTTGAARARRAEAQGLDSASESSAADIARAQATMERLRATAAIIRRETPVVAMLLLDAARIIGALTQSDIAIASAEQSPPHGSTSHGV